ncbi:MAG: aquaporin [Planctomycetota bacterium]
MFPTDPTLGATLPSGSDMRSFALDTILTAILMLAVLRTTVGEPAKVALAGVAIGSVVALEAMFAGPVCGASMNPARSLAPALVSGRTESLWIYVAAPMLGAFLGVAADRLMYRREREPSP